MSSLKGIAVTVLLAVVVFAPGPARAGTVARLAPAPAPAAYSVTDTWTTIFADDFEGGFPNSWTRDIGSGATAIANWGEWTCWSGYSPTHSVGCAVIGPDRIDCGGNYPAGMSAWMRCGPFDLSDPAFVEATLSFNYTLDVGAADVLIALVSSDGNNFFGDYPPAALNTAPYTLDVTSVGIGHATVWIAFLFESDAAGSRPNGAQVDDVVLRVRSTATNQAPQVTVTSPNGGETWQAGSGHAITWTATDPDGGPNPLTIGLDWSSNSGATWSPIAIDQANAGTYTWTVPADATSTARARVRASDGLDEGSDTSNADFTITGPPAGNNTLAVGDGQGVSGTSITVPLILTNEVAVKGLQVDLLFDDGVAHFAAVAAADRGAGMTVASEVVSDGRVRVVLFHDDAATIAAGTGTIANLVFDLVGTGGAQTNVTPADAVLSDADAQPLGAALAPGILTIAANTEAPALQIAVLENPGRVRTLQIVVQVTRGSGDPPAVTAGGASVAMSQLGDNRYLGTVAAAGTAGSVTIVATDTNASGTGTGQVTVSFE